MTKSCWPSPGEPSSPNRELCFSWPPPWLAGATTFPGLRQVCRDDAESRPLFDQLRAAVLASDEAAARRVEDLLEAAARRQSLQMPNHEDIQSAVAWLDAAPCLEWFPIRGLVAELYR